MNEPVRLSVPQRNIQIIGLSTGTVRVKRSHREAGGTMAKIILDWRWTDPLPVYCWLILHPEGSMLVDTGENARVRKRNYLACDSINGLINRWILRFQIDEHQEIGLRLAEVDVSIDEIKTVILTHLHLDHTDGLAYFPNARVLVGQTEWERPFGAVPCVWPDWLKPELVRYTEPAVDFPFAAFPITTDGAVKIISSPGHTYGHQSVLVDAGDFDVLLAGDISFNQQQVLDGEVPGINIDQAASRQTFEKILEYRRQKPLIYLPSHDPESGHRLMNREFL